MTFFESLLVLLLAAVALLQVARRLSLPYPALLAIAGVGMAYLPGAPTIVIEPATALALFIAPVLLDAAFDFPLSAARRLWRPLVILAVVAVVATAASVAWIGWAFAGLPIAAAVVLGAIVAPPDAAATTAVLGSVSLPRRTTAVLRGESLFNDATALLLFSEALAVQNRGSLAVADGVSLMLAAPAGIALGIVLALAMRRVRPRVSGTLSDSILQFLAAFLVWIVAERLHLSVVLTVVAFAMTLARSTTGRSNARSRLHSYPVWSTVVFVLNVLAFLLMGMQARLIVGRMPTARLAEAAMFVALVIVAITLTRFAVVMSWNLLARRFDPVRGDLPPPTPGQGLLVSWSGVRGLLTMATAFALPAAFPQRDLVVLTAFGVVLATLVLQGLTLKPVIRLLGLHRMENPDEELRNGHLRLAQAGLRALGSASGPEADMLRRDYALQQGQEAARDRHRTLGLQALAAERAALDRMRDRHEIGQDSFLALQESIDLRELALLPDTDRRIEES